MKLSTKDYKKIVLTLKLNVNADIRSTKKLDSIMKQSFSSGRQNVLNELTELLKRPCLIAGAGPSLEYDFQRCIENDILRKVKIIAVDGTCSLFHQLQISPHIIVTDLDGDWHSILWGINQGATTLVHAHGDNQNLIEDFFHNIDYDKEDIKIWGTTQNDIKTNLFNFGGFTDGDRAIFLTFEFQTPIIGLIGFNFGKKIGKYSMLNPSLKKNVIKKQEKFKIALSLISRYHQTHRGHRLNLTSQGEIIQGFNSLSVLEFKNLVDEWYVKQHIEEFPR
jgi:uncharacterized Rossmann fold enzyme